MAFSLSCDDISRKCEFKVYGETKEEVLLDFEEHIKTFHGISGLSINVINQFLKFVREEKPA
jgi:predicted small metal-binding protein